MIDFSVLVSQLIQLFCIMGLGYLAFKTKILNETVNKHMSSFVLQITMPFMILDAVLKLDESAKPSGSIIAVLFIASALFYIIMPIIAFVLVKFLSVTINIKKHRQGLYMFMLVFANVGFMGFPILQAACGENGDLAVFYAAILNVFFNLGSFTYGIIMIGYGTESKAKFSWKKFITPGMFSSFSAIAIYALGIHYPKEGTNMLGDVLHGIFSTVGGLTPALAMILVGSTLATVKLKEVFNYWRLYVFVGIKQVILPIIFYPIFRLLIKDDLLSTVLFIEFLMPIANSALIFANQYDLDDKFTSKAIFISTLFSLVTIPGMLYITSLMPF